uniref:C2H2-type domain-containing protein n=1 Tax=Panagrolaimus superbus TaxID=310955 RepID=A0A914Z7S0_9BILA
MSDDPDSAPTTAAAAETTTAIATTTTTTEAAASSSLRRSKRNKFHLDVAAIHHGRSHSPAISHLTVLQPLHQHHHQQHSQPGPSTIIKASPRNSPICTFVPKHEQEIITVNNHAVQNTTNISSKKSSIKKSSATTINNNNNISREETSTPESLGKRIRKATVFDDFSYSIDSEDDAEAHVNYNNRVAAGIEYAKNNHNSIITDNNINISTTIKSDNEYPCPRCPAQFETRVGLTNHLKLHGANKTFPCHSCDFSCTNRKTMRQHKRVHGQSAPPKKRKSVDTKLM